MLRQAGVREGKVQPSHSLHLAVSGPLLEVHTELLETGASLLDVRDGNSNVAEAASGLGVAGGVALELGVALGA